MRKIVKSVHKWLCVVAGYQVVVYWGEKTFEHYTMSYNDAIDWMAQYPIDALVIVVAGYDCEYVTSRYA